MSLADQVKMRRGIKNGNMIFRKGKYYFLWSEDDTRSENYRVRYGIADSPVGPIQIPESNLILAKDPEKGIYGTGHNSVIQVPGKVEHFTSEQTERFAKMMRVATADEVKDLRRQVKTLEAEVAKLKKKIDS